MRARPLIPATLVLAAACAPAVRTVVGTGEAVAAQMVDIASGQYAPNTSATFTITLEGDRWTTEGGMSTTRFREVWRRVR